MKTHRITAVKGITGKITIKRKNKHTKLPAVARVYTKAEIEAFAKLRGLKVSKNVK